MSKVVALAGGVGGAKLAHGLALAGADLTVVVNTGDDFRPMGLHVSPDIDTVVYTLSGLANRAQGWGIEGETWSFMEQVSRLGGPTWFNLGDRDLAMHVLRTQRLAAGETLTAITGDFAARLGIASRILPMCDEAVATMVRTPDGELPFQDYFVRLRCAVTVEGFRFAGIDNARASDEVVAALADPDLSAVIVCPSNPFVSVDPILSVPGLRAAIPKSRPIVAVSPIIAGQAVKGPAAAMLRDLGFDVSALGVARHYAGWIGGLVVDTRDEALAASIEALGMKVLLTDTLMKTDSDRERLARETLAFAERLGGAP
ncbi:2-phospho-L-lactate transferase [Alsobacter sp. SYSU M60028]|uniref:2-phospho-L-lactate transferase n=1 Tax=Alsobacter ponti TaxID=2962936 RepID=A0ABT1LGB0_9HYPH|nr:2-phospho-L-lactate transferase [Alsobacter ponti]MCP8939938.1 2-phospho-L-lactate transferase [Alsobacter ponti]